MEGEEEFLVVMGGVFARVCWIDHQEAVLASVLGFFEVGSGEGVGVIPAKACGAGRVGVAGLAAGRNHGRALFHGAVDIWR